MQWWKADYLRDTRHLSLSARGLWTDILMHAADTEPRGKLTMTLGQLAMKCSCLSVREVALALIELGTVHDDEKPVADIEPPVDYLCEYLKANDDLTLMSQCVSIMSRRITREEKHREYERLRKQNWRGGKPVP